MCTAHQTPILYGYVKMHSTLCRIISGKGKVFRIEDQRQEGAAEAARAAQDRIDHFKSG